MQLPVVVGRGLNVFFLPFVVVETAYSRNHCEGAQSIKIPWRSSWKQV